MPKERTIGGSHTAPKQVLAALLAVLLLAAATFSVSGFLHRLLHQDDSAAHLCLACSFAKSLLDVAEVASAAVALVLVLSFQARPVPSTILLSCDYRLLPSRAPPSV